MATTPVSIVGGPAPYREALAAKLETIGLATADSGGALVIFCSTEALDGFLEAERRSRGGSDVSTAERSSQHEPAIWCDRGPNKERRR